ncbi:hypothetical protein ERJ75_000243300 [Trypanosoma vivax]|uniref:Uncharacterized protein n=1 Tax=Trypanosoma vivax (strain Y486) TaxID=1055687 RepID=G0U3U5_TRYVY|nr:hypothetical protein ERJ75_000243300 [Trypanosoma vivax]CCC50185.1 conserved hypothetical protein [Trypanosoma vivax Y486]
MVMLLRHFKKLLVPAAGCRCCGAPTHNVYRLEAFGIVHRVFADRGYGFALMLPPPPSLMSRIVPETRSRSETLRETPSNTGGRELNSSNKLISVRFPLEMAACDTFGAGVPQKNATGPSPQAIIGPGSHVKFTATARYDESSKTCIWRTRKVTPCDPREELRATLSRLRDALWDKIILEDIQELRQQSAWNSKPMGRTRGSCPSTTGRERMPGYALEYDKATEWFIVREADLSLPRLMWEHERSVSGVDKITESTFPGSSEERKRRWDRITERLREREV